MYLHSGYSDAHFVGDLLVEASGCGLKHDLTFAGTERIKTLPKCAQGFLVFSAGTIVGKPSLDGIEKLLVTEWFCEKLYGATFHGLHRHRDIAMGRNKDDWEQPVRGGKFALKVETAQPRQSHVEHQASGAIGQRGLEEISNRRKLPAIAANRPQQSCHRVTKLGVVVDDQDNGLRVRHSTLGALYLIEQYQLYFHRHGMNSPSRLSAYITN